MYVTHAHITPFLNDLPFDFPTTSMQFHHSLATYSQIYFRIYMLRRYKKIDIKFTKNLRKEKNRHFKNKNQISTKIKFYDLLTD